MSDFDKCPICGEYDFLDKHKCAPIYRVFDLDEGHDSEVRAHGFESAAEKYVQENDGDWEYSVAEGQAIELYVSKDGVTKLIKVTGENEPVYYTEEIKGKDDEEGE